MVDPLSERQVWRWLQQGRRSVDVKSRRYTNRRTPSTARVGSRDEWERKFLFQESGPDGPCACKTEISCIFPYMVVILTALVLTEALDPCLDTYVGLLFVRHVGEGVSGQSARCILV